MKYSNILGPIACLVILGSAIRISYAVGRYCGTYTETEVHQSVDKAYATGYKDCYDKYQTNIVKLVDIVVAQQATLSAIGNTFTNGPLGR